MTSRIANIHLHKLVPTADSILPSRMVLNRLRNVIIRMVQDGVGELAERKMASLIELKYHSIGDAKSKFGELYSNVDKLGKLLYRIP